MNDVKIGDRVTVIDRLENYPDYVEKFTEIAPNSKWVGGDDSLKNGDVLKVIGIGKHDSSGSTVYAVEDSNGNGFLIDALGVEKSIDKTNICKFEIGNKVRYSKRAGKVCAFEHMINEGDIGEVVAIDANFIKVNWKSRPSSHIIFTCWCDASNCTLIDNTTKLINYTVSGNTVTITLPNGNIGVAKCHPKDKFSEYEGIRIALARAYGIEPPTEEKAEKPKYEFEIGDIVTIENRGEVYPDYISKFKEIAPNGRWNNGKRIPHTTFKIIGRGQHDICSYGNLYAVQDFDGIGYLVGEGGLKKIL